MKIIFRKPLTLNHLCLTSSGSPDGYAFKNILILSRDNIKVFIKEYKAFDGIFVFNKETQELALSLWDEDLRHRKMARFQFGEASSAKMIGALLTFVKTDREVSFELYGESCYFGKPSEQDLKMVVDSLQELLESIGLPSTIEIKPDCTIIRSKLPEKT